MLLHNGNFLCREVVALVDKLGYFRFQSRGVSGGVGGFGLLDLVHQLFRLLLGCGLMPCIVCPALCYPPADLAIWGGGFGGSIIDLTGLQRYVWAATPNENSLTMASR